MTWSGVTTSRPSGLARRLASLATEIDDATPTEQVMPCSSCTVARTRSATSTGEPSRAAPRTSRKASSREIASTRGVIRRNTSITDRDTVVNRS